ncbi:hypothetical protein SXANM310S_03965 [Streptomyces xanthochromogenes]
MQALFSSGSLTAVYPKWHEPAGGWGCTVYFVCGPGPYGNDAGAPLVPAAGSDVFAGAGFLAPASGEPVLEQPTVTTVSSRDAATEAMVRTLMTDAPEVTVTGDS